MIQQYWMCMSAGGVSKVSRLHHRITNAQKGNYTSFHDHTQYGALDPARGTLLTQALKRKAKFNSCK
jgi:hypothetical protein